MSPSVDEVPVESDCLFCRIAGGETTAQIVAEGPDTVAFLDHRPLFVGHTLVVPRLHYATLPDLPDALIGPLFAETRRLASAMTSAFGAAGSFVAINNVVSQSVPHLHVHVVPRNRKDGLKGFFWPRTKYRDVEHMADTAALLRSSLAAESHSEGYL